jgi:hypothetical protein
MMTFPVEFSTGVALVMYVKDGTIFFVNKSAESVTLDKEMDLLIVDAGTILGGGTPFTHTVTETSSEACSVTLHRTCELPPHYRM